MNITFKTANFLVLLRIFFTNSSFDPLNCLKVRSTKHYYCYVNLKKQRLIGQVCSKEVAAEYVVTNG